jgi:hypothetical protein
VFVAIRPDRRKPARSVRKRARLAERRRLGPGPSACRAALSGRRWVQGAVRRGGQECGDGGGGGQVHLRLGRRRARGCGRRWPSPLTTSARWYHQRAWQHAQVGGCKPRQRAQWWQPQAAGGVPARMAPRGRNWFSGNRTAAPIPALAACTCVALCNRRLWPCAASRRALDSVVRCRRLPVRGPRRRCHHAAAAAAAAARHSLKNGVRARRGTPLRAAAAVCRRRSGGRCGVDGRRRLL